MKRLSERAEFWIVLLVVYGYPVGAGIWERASVDIPAPIEFSDGALWVTLAYELIVAALVLGFLHMRAVVPWSELRASISWMDTWKGVGVFIAAVAGSWVAYAFVMSVPTSEERLAAVVFQGSVSVPVALLVSLVNPLFEECINLGYVQQRLRDHGPGIAIGAALLLRMLTHLYQGLHAVVGVVPIGLVFGIYAWRTGRLWPVIVAHALLDLFGLLTLSHQ